MGGAGPDLIHTTNPDMFGDVNKAAMSGAFQSWDKLIKDWDRESIYANALDRASSNNGELYLLPLAFESTFIVTTKNNMEEFSLTEDDFSGFYKTTDTILSLYEKVPENRYVHQNLPEYLKLMPEIFDYESGKTSINEVQELFEKWESISKKLEEMETDGVYRYLDGTDMFSEGERILEFYTFYALCRRYGAGFVSDKVEEEHQYLFI